MYVTIVNMNLDAGELDGCRALQTALVQLGAGAEIVHFAALRRGEPWRGDGVVLGPQGTPFDAYDPQFLPWLREFTDRLSVPVLAVCGGMQALTLALGGTLQTVDGGPQATGGDYGQRERIVGPVAVTLDVAQFPQVWGEVTLDLLREMGPSPQLWQRHAEQVATVPDELLVVGRSARTPIEAWVHRERPWLASQFHPERGWDEGCEGGKLWLRGWLGLVAS